MWRERLAEFSTDLEFQPASSEEAVDQAERTVGVRFPYDLRSFLLEADGLRGKHRVGLVWPSGRIAKDNISYRQNADFATLYMPFDALLFFGDAGNGDQFAFAIVGGEIRAKDIFVWDHENDGRIWVAPSLDRYLEWWLTGQLTR